MLEHCVPEEEKIQAGILFCPADPELVAIKRKTHDLDVDYNMTHEDEFEKRDAILHEILGEMFDVKDAKIPLPQHAHLFESYVCEACGEVTGANWIRLAGGKKLCVDCYKDYDRFHV